MSDKTATWLRRATPAEEDGTDSLRRELDAVAGRDEFRRFSEHGDELIAWILTWDAQELLESARQWELDRQRLARVAAVEKSNRRRRRVLAAAYSAVLFLSGLVAALAVFVGWWLDVGPASGAWSWWLRVLGVGGGAVVMTVGAVGIVRARENVGSGDWHVTYATQEWQRTRDVALSQAYRRAINQVLGPRGIVPFPEQAPDLVELSTDKIVPSETIQYVTRFVEQHTSSAIGVAGPRGVGKSTLMSAVAAADGQLVIRVPISVVYEGLDFMRRLAFSIIDQSNLPLELEHDRIRSSPMRSRVQRLMTCYLAVAIGGFALWADASDAWYITKVGAVGTAGVILALAGLSYFLVQLRPRPARHYRADSAGELARALAADLQFEVADTLEQRAGITLSSFLGLERGSSHTQTARGLSYGDVSERLRRLLQQLGEEYRSRGRVVVLVDELDKLPDPEALIGTVNSLKDLFHLPRVHFIVSVSDEALAAFELRGIQPRDAFDSSFDAIIEMERLSEPESLEILESRVAGFPEQLGALCHVWAGGLPRDVIRGARTCIDLFNNADVADTWQSTARAFLKTDLTARFKALARTETRAGGRPSHEVMATIDRWVTDGLPRDDLQPTQTDPTPVDALLVFSACCVRALDLVTEAAGPAAADKREILCRAVAGLADGPSAIEAASVAVRRTFV